MRFYEKFRKRNIPGWSLVVGSIIISHGKLPFRDGCKTSRCCTGSCRIEQVLQSSRKHGFSDRTVGNLVRRSCSNSKHRGRNQLVWRQELGTIDTIIKPNPEIEGIVIKDSFSNHRHVCLRRVTQIDRIKPIITVRRHRCRGLTATSAGAIIAPVSRSSS